MVREVELLKTCQEEAKEIVKTQKHRMKHGLHYYDCKNRVDYTDECDKFKELDTCI